MLPSFFAPNFDMVGRRMSSQLSGAHGMVSAPWVRVLHGTKTVPIDSYIHTWDPVLLHLQVCGRMNFRPLEEKIAGLVHPHTHLSAPFLLPRVQRAEGLRMRMERWCAVRTIAALPYSCAFAQPHLSFSSSRHYPVWWFPDG